MKERGRTGRSERSSSFLTSILAPLAIPAILLLATDLRLPKSKRPRFNVEKGGNGATYYDRSSSILHIATGAFVRVNLTPFRFLVKDYAGNTERGSRPHSFIEYDLDKVANLWLGHPEERLGHTGVVAVFRPEYGNLREV